MHIDAWRKYLEPLDVLEETAEVLVLEAADKFKRDWILDHLVDAVAEEFTRATGRRVEVRVVARAEE